MKDKYKEISEKFTKGVELAARELIEERKKNNSYLVVSENGKVIRKPASEFKL